MTDTDFTTSINSYVPAVSQSEIARIITDHTSGTSGPEKRVYYTEGDLKKTVEIFAKGISEMHPEKTLVCFAYTGEYGLGNLISTAVKSLGAVPIEAGMGLTYKEYLDIIEKEKPDSFIGFPQLLLALQRLSGGCFKNGLISGDYCIKADYMCPVFPHYGSREMGLAGAISCSCHSGMHMRPDVKIEIVDEQGNPVPDGSEGELVISTPEMEAMPLHRYKTGDYTYIIPGKCDCGSDWLRIGPVRRKSSCESLDDEAFADPNVIDRFGNKKILISDMNYELKHYYTGKRK